MITHGINDVNNPYIEIVNNLPDGSFSSGVRLTFKEDGVFINYTNESLNYAFNYKDAQKLSVFIRQFKELFLEKKEV